MRRSTSNLYRRLRDGPESDHDNPLPTVVPPGVAARLKREAAEVLSRQPASPSIYDQDEEIHESLRTQGTKEDRISNIVKGLSIATVALSLGSVLTVATGLNEASSDRRSTVDDEKARELDYNAMGIQRKMTDVAATFIGDRDLGVFCSDTSVYTSDKDIKNGIKTVGLYFNEDVTTSGEPTILLHPLVCDRLEYPDFYSAEKVGDAVIFFAHEVGHATGEYDEGITNCIAVELFDQFAIDLEVEDHVAEVEPLDLAKTIPGAEYHSAGC